MKGKRKFKKVYLKVLDEQVTNECTVQVQNILFIERKTCHRLNFSDQNQWEDSEKRQVTLTKW